MRLDRFARKHGGNLPVTRQRNVHHEMMARHLGDLEQLAVKRIAFDRAFHRLRVAHEFRAVQDLDRFLSGQSWSDQFPRAGESGHQMRLDEAECDVQIGGYEVLGDVNGRARFRVAQEAVLGKFARVVIDDAIRRRRSPAIGSRLTRPGVASRCSPVAIRIVTSLASNPAAWSRFSSGGSTSLFGAGRVMSQTEIATVFFPLASSLRAGPAIGSSIAASIAPSWSGRGDADLASSTLYSKPVGQVERYSGLAECKLRTHQFKAIAVEAVERQALFGPPSHAPASGPRGSDSG